MVIKIPGDIVEQLERDGFARITNVMGPNELEALQQVLRETVILRPKPFYLTDFDFEHGGRAPDGVAINGDALYRVKYSLAKHRRFLALLGNPTLLNLASAIIGEPFVVCWEDLMVKEAGEPFGVPWHQDSEADGDRVHTVGAYISGSGDNPLRVIPGSHKLGVLPTASLSKAVEASAADALSLNANPGDLVVHNINILHESGPCGADSRYTIFFEFRSIRMILGMPDWGLPFVKARKHFVGAAVRARRSFPDLVREDEQRGLSIAPFRELWDPGDELPPESELNFRVSQSRDRLCISPSREHEQNAIQAFLEERDIQSVASRFGVSEEALFKWLCGAGVFSPNEQGRYLDSLAVPGVGV